MLDDQVVPESTFQDSTIQQSEPTEQRSKVDYNFAEMRRKLEEAERRAQAAEQMLHSQQSNQQPSLQVDEEDFNIDNEDYVQAKHVKTSTKKLHKKLSATEEKIQKLEQKLSYFEAKVDTDSLKDFDSVVSNDNLKELARRFPDDYGTMMMNPDLKAKSKTAYNMIKNYGISTKIDTSDIDHKIASNKLKPQSASVASPQSANTPLSRLNDYERRVLSDSDKDRILAEVERKKMSW
jgi:hypothetical protein